MDTLSRPLTRKQLQEFLPNIRSVIAFENLQTDTANTGDTISSAQFVTLSANSNLNEAHVLTASDNIALSDGDSTVALDLTDTGVAADTYGDAMHVIALTVDGKGRIHAAEAFRLNTDNIDEGSLHLFFTVARARAAISAGPGIDYNPTTGIVATTGFTGSGLYTNLTFVDGICTAAT